MHIRKVGHIYFQQYAPNLLTLSLILILQTREIWINMTFHRISHWCILLMTSWPVKQEMVRQEMVGGLGNALSQEKWVAFGYFSKLDSFHVTWSLHSSTTPRFGMCCLQKLKRPRRHCFPLCSVGCKISLLFWRWCSDMFLIPGPLQIFVAGPRIFFIIYVPSFEGHLSPQDFHSSMLATFCSYRTIKAMTLKVMK